MTVRLVLLAALAGTGCKNAVTGPGDSLAGTWKGAIVDAVSGAGVLSLTMSQQGVGVSGTWSATFSNGGVTTAGTLSGSTAASQVSLFLTPSIATVCSSGASVSGTLGVTATRSGNRLAGSYVAFSCTGSVTGSIDVEK